MTRTQMLVALAAVAITAGAPSVAGPLKPEQEAKIHPVGKAVDCIQIPAIEETRVRDDKTIDFYMGGRKVYRNTLPHECSQLGAQQAFSYETSLSELCSTDTIRVIYPGSPQGPGPICGLGQFQPIEGAPK